MKRQEININEFCLKPFKQFDKDWFVLTAGDFPASLFNAMTISWGSIGIIWNRPMVQVVVRPTRYTYQFIEKHDTFTLCSFSEEQHDAMSLIGSKSGRDGDKILESGLTLIPSKEVAAPGFDEAELIIECRKIYWGDIDPQHFLETDIHQNYALKDYHRFYFGEILHLEGADRFSTRS
ncbi:MAG: flavin reductase family protein [Anaerolineaceae bacterium]|nr:flavin reductase family protein [Anaerolineaceae bacterium]MBN2676626.1 flavin reductase family protein [Anaerolineaceae bacterium]